METLDKNIKLAYDLIKSTSKSVFLTGKAGTGKTTFLKTLPTFTSKRMAIVAPTGVAALNAGGVTIHSLFQLPFTPFIPEGADISFVVKDNDGKLIREQYKMSATKIKILRSLDLLVIDEISMVRSDLLDAVDDVLRHYRRSSLPFGGVQLLMIGDLYQLTPVIKDDEWRLIQNFYRSPYFFDSNALRRIDYVTVELTHIFRQQDETFISILNEIRTNSLTAESLAVLNSRVADIDDNSEGCIRLTTHNSDANSINASKLEDLADEPFHFVAEIKDNFPAYMYPTEEDLVLKLGAQVMFIRNDSSTEKLYYNGKIGKIVDIDSSKIMVLCPGDYSPIEVKTEVWENIQYVVNSETNEIEQNVIGEFHQYPLRLAWAITIHKSQGLTFDRAIVDVHSAFAFGQVYVALSRCRSLLGLTLKTPISSRMIKSDLDVVTFCDDARKKQPDEQKLKSYVIAFEREILLNVFSMSNLQRLLSDVRQVYMSNFSRFNPAYSQEILDVVQSFDTQVFDVSKKFVAQLWRIFSESPDVAFCDNEYLKDRISKASDYFCPKISEIIGSHFSNMLLESDNKEVDSEMKSALEKLELEYQKKVKCFEKMHDGFSTEMYMRVISDIDNMFVPTFSRKSKVVYNVSSSDGLYAALNAWRKSVADDFNMPVYYILPQKSLVDIVKNKPRNAKELCKIKGVGAMKVRQFGNDILNIVSEYCHEFVSGRELDLSDASSQEPVVKEKKTEVHKKGDSAKKSLEMFRSGMSIEAIANERGFVIGTVFSHLSRFIQTGEIEPQDLIGQEKFNSVMDFLEQYDTSVGVMDLYKIASERFTKDELRVGIAFLNKMNDLK